MTETAPTILRIDSSGRQGKSYSRPLADRLIAGLEGKIPGAKVVSRDLTATVPPVVDEAWFDAAYTPEDDRDATAKAALAVSDEIVDEFLSADAVVITVPIYNFSVSAQLKLWIDQVARFGRTFTYTENGPKGLGADRPTYLIVASGGTKVDSDIDFATGYMRHVLSFVGITNVHVIEADQLMQMADTKIPAAEAQIDTIIKNFSYDMPMVSA
ncbi:NAD(P)H-dependent oxidoreductase [Roseobacter sp. YSTF-M11]|uniref:FMN dependent NADH:quinone oxidoreductase n=1 Tax=Roseobacter insulae TaxID=2859783 RepID=A0A9X1K1B1_9RHOB|nr:NAD(P)H-dependent oxidoreductase [Roseobacter insulae]MBW4706347.1 NAD(P)H-dependent oxidoreductase [Roseobacter insulae]